MQTTFSVLYRLLLQKIIILNRCNLLVVRIFWQTVVGVVDVYIDETEHVYSEKNTSHAIE